MIKVYEINDNVVLSIEICCRVGWGIMYFEKLLLAVCFVDYLLAAKYLFGVGLSYLYYICCSDQFNIAICLT